MVVCITILRHIRQVKSMEYSVIIFDTAPTGHTLRFLSFPAALQKGFSKIFSLKSKFGGLFSQVFYVFVVWHLIFFYLFIFTMIFIFYLYFPVFNYIFVVRPCLFLFLFVWLLLFVNYFSDVKYFDARRV